MKAINNIVILGGGTSAWLSAAFLINNFPFYKITVVDKEIGTPVGVGEGTLMNFESFMTNCGFNINEWFTKCHASLKAGVIFPNWVRKGHQIWHPFSMNPTLGNGISLHTNWSDHQHYDFKTQGLELYDISLNHNKVDVSKKYAYHVDASKLVEFIQEKIVDKITLIKSEMISFTRDSQNNIVSLELKNGTSISGDLFLDCTGFKNLLQYQPIKVALADRLICDTAVTVQIPYQDILQEQKPYVICDAVDHGWIWTSPVKTRMGSGLVFNRSITSIEEAKNYLSNYWNGRADVDKIKVIDWTPFYNENIWHENVISIGLSAGFLEPLESTGIALIMEGIYQLAERIADLNYSENDKIIYNSTMKEFFESSINFVSMHYSYTERSEPFWLEVKERIKINQEQQLYMDMLKNKNLPLSGITKRTNFFTTNNWNTWLIQMGYEVAPRNIKDSEFYLNKWYDNDEKFRHQFGVVHLDYLERNQYLFEKYSKFK